jgi:hypothetical protein
MKVYIVEAESGYTDHGSAMLFDSVWADRESAEEYAKEKFAQSGWASQAPEYEITEVTLEGVS